ncbi:DUF3223 domain-containing protein [Paenarthrobacter ilicis]|uniref:Uncharacterized protein n=1 Tax=Paenarthrobacter ilicis TaxID=43665 RepID=A0ABX0TK75_9MICC|nr:DUF3223 domain-containing protein [Paenarthrobacter ilicis]MBM7794446.1 hypothetical protein [Paenarthrobacter ilicis]NIJ02270.1 hypothetical protein [Paenarthrobacter ilicis]
MKKYEVGEFSFRTKREVRELLKTVLEELEADERVTDSFVSSLLTALAREHPAAADKIGDGIEYWVVASNKDLGYTSKGFRAKQRDRDELVLFSYTDVISPPKQQALVAEALTREALEITRNFRTAAFASGPVQCALTAREIPEKTMADVVHLNPPRAQLHQRFLASEGLTYEAVELIKHDTESGFRLADRDLADRWREFQNGHLEGLAIVLRRER